MEYPMSGLWDEDHGDGCQQTLIWACLSAYMIAAISQRKIEGGALVQLCLSPDAPAVTLNNALGEG
jgi:hypothetical protein